MPYTDRSEQLAYWRDYNAARREKQKRYHRRYRLRPYAIKAHSESARAWAERNAEYVKRRNLEKITRWRIEKPLEAMLKRAKRRARERGYRFNISIGDLKPVRVCPLLRIKLEYKPLRLGAPNAASIDRIVNSKGYTKGNVHIISQRANLMKGARSLKEFMRRLEK